MHDKNTHNRSLDRRAVVLHSPHLPGWIKGIVFNFSILIASIISIQAKPVCGNATVDISHNIQAMWHLNPWGPLWWRRGSSGVASSHVFISTDSCRGLSINDYFRLFKFREDKKVGVIGGTQTDTSASYIVRDCLPQFRASIVLLLHINSTDRCWVKDRRHMPSRFLGLNSQGL